MSRAPTPEVTGTRTGPGRRGAVAVAGAALVAVLAVLGAALAAPWHAEPPPDLRAVTPASAAPTPRTSAPAEETPAELAEVDTGLDLRVLLLVVLLVLFVLLARYLVARASLARGGAQLAHANAPGRTVVEAFGADMEVDPDLPALRRGVDAAQAVLAGTRDPGDAVIAAWLALEDAAASSGVPRSPAATPTEFTTAVLDATAADAAATRTLLALYHRARFAPGAQLGPGEVATARECLSRLAASWEQRP